MHAGGLVAEMGLIRIAHANHLRILFAEERIHYARTTAAGANEPDREAVAGADWARPRTAAGTMAIVAAFWRKRRRVRLCFFMRLKFLDANVVPMARRRLSSVH